MLLQINTLKTLFHFIILFFIFTLGGRGKGKSRTNGTGNDLTNTDGDTLTNDDSLPNSGEVYKMNIS